MKRHIQTGLLALSLVVIATSTALAEDATRSAATKEAQKVIDQAKAASRASDKLAKFKEAANKFIDQRIAEINKEINLVNSAKRLTESDKADLIADLNAAKTGLTNLKATIAARTDAETAKLDIKKIFEDYKIFAVLGPKIEGLTAAAKMSYQVDKLATAAGKIRSLIDRAKAAGKDTTQMESLYADYQAKVADAKTQIAAARSKFKAMKVSDAPGAKTLFLEGKALLKTAKADIIAAHKDLQGIIPLVRTSLGIKEASESAKPATGSSTATASGTR